MRKNEFANQVVVWYEQHGRKDLPWQHPASPYRVWVSEVMLQQTRVASVIPYFLRFMQSFPTVHALAKASQDKVLQHWSGLGYYARGRNLHRAAQILVQKYQGVLPKERETLQSLPGIGRSTSGAILALSCGIAHPILDGNVKRVLARFGKIKGWPGQKEVEKKLWQMATHFTPKIRVAAYTQAMMDLGATLCLRRRPLCTQCPIQTNCKAHQTGREEHYPSPKPKRARPVRQLRMLLLTKAGRVLLERRPPAGIWGGLWSLPECSVAVDVEDWCQKQLGYRVLSQTHWTMIRHDFSHFTLEISPIYIQLGTCSLRITENDPHHWYTPGETFPGGIATPIEGLLHRFGNVQK